MFGLLGLDWERHVASDPRYFRPAQVDLLLGDACKARRVLGWKPKVTFKELARRMTEHDHRIARRERAIRDHDRQELVEAK